MKKIEIWTDGACKGNPGIGGWGVFIKKDDKETLYLNGFEKSTTNNRMELTAVIKALDSLIIKDSTIILYTDSQYVMNGITKWISNWERNGWRTANNKAVKNIDLWKILFQQTTTTHNKIIWRWVKGHSGDYGNEVADHLANKSINEYEKVKD